MLLKTLEIVKNEPVITLVDYDDIQLRNIFLERNGYLLKVIHDWGKDYGGSQNSENQEVYYEEIIPERILVKCNSFCGAMISSEYDYTNGGHYVEYKDKLLLVDCNSPYNDGTSKNGFYFANDDHCRWNYFTYQIVDRRESEE